jgi:hypothetical protein
MTPTVTPLVREVLFGPAPTAKERMDWAREALERAGTLSPAGRPATLRLVLPAAALAAGLVVLLFLLPPPDRPLAPAVAPADVAGERARNEAALASAEVQGRLKEAPAGSFAAIARGKLVALETDLARVEAVLAALDPAPAHAFLFPVGREGDRQSETTFDYEVVAGCGFLASAGLSMGGGARGWIFARENQGEGTMFPSADGRPFLPLRLGPGEGEPVTFLVATGFGGPLILPDGLAYPRSEIPGRTTVKGMTDRVYRRHYVLARVPELGLDLHVEALGDLLTPLPPWTLGGVAWPAVGAKRVEEAKAAGKRLLLLAVSAGSPIRLGPFDEKAGPGLYADVVTARHTAPWNPAPGLPGPEGGFRNPEFVLYAVTAAGPVVVARLDLSGDVTAARVAEFLRPR